MEFIPDLVGSNKIFWRAAGIGNSAGKSASLILTFSLTYNSYITCTVQ